MNKPPIILQKPGVACGVCGMSVEYTNGNAFQCSNADCDARGYIYEFEPKLIGEPPPPVKPPKPAILDEPKAKPRATPAPAKKK